MVWFEVGPSGSFVDLVNNQTVAGIKTWSGNQIYNGDIIATNTPGAFFAGEDTKFNITSVAASTGANIRMTGTSGGVNRLRYLTSGAGSSSFRIRDESAGVDRLNIDSGGAVTIPGAFTASSTVTLSTNAAPGNASTVVRWIPITAGGQNLLVPGYQ